MPYLAELPADSFDLNNNGDINESIPYDLNNQNRIVGNNVDLGVYEFGNPEPPEELVEPPFEPTDPLLQTPIWRFQNSQLLGTYLFVGQEEGNNILQNFRQFNQEGFAFYVGAEENDDLMPMYRFQNSDILGTYLYANEGERESILANFPNFILEGIAFYVYGAGSNRANPFYRFQNSQLPGTYIFVSEGERQNILANFPTFIEEGIAFEVTG